MAVSMRKQIAQNKRNTIIIMIIFVFFITLVGAAFALLHRDLSLLVWFFVISLAYATIQYFLADKIAILSSGARRADRAEYSRYYRVVEKLVAEAKIAMPKLYVINDAAPNAFATGRNPDHASVAVTSGLMDIMDDKELRAVLGHELSHIKNYDIRLNMIVFGLVSLVGLISDFGLRTLLYSDRDEEDNSPIGMLFVLIVLICSPIFATLVQFAVSRQREYLADASSASLVGNSEDMANALRKLDAHTRPMHQQNIATEALFIVNPLKKSIISRLFSTHPPIESRIERLENAKK
ncbi:M48 family metalloprotease [Candidatus Saccharibacteria bacterium]|nr:M48 family metalloprotease [Candidatus Saccharibacteria bacterium]